MPLIPVWNVVESMLVNQSATSVFVIHIYDRKVFWIGNTASQYDELMT